MTAARDTFDLVARQHALDTRETALLFNAALVIALDHAAHDGWNLSPLAIPPEGTPLPSRLPPLRDHAPAGTICADCGTPIRARQSYVEVVEGAIHWVCLKRAAAEGGAP